MATMLFCFGLLTGLVTGWLILALLTFITIRRRKKAAAKPRSHANDIPYTLVNLALFGSFFPLLATWVLAALA